MDYSKNFESRESLHLYKAQRRFLAYLGLPLKNKTVLEVGTGIGLLTDFFEERDCAVLSTDGRPENVRENLRRHPWRAGRTKVVDLMIPGSHDHLGNFDIVFCCGVLHHTSSPAMVIADLAGVCDSLFLLLGIVAPKELKHGWPIHHRVEKEAPDKSLHQLGCCPQRCWLWDELKKHFEYVYIPRTQPDHYDYPRKWPTKKRHHRWPRAIFVASRTELSLPTLSNKLLRKQESI